ncbi:MAG: aminopeptidase P N-terminal domain-containing protein [Chitinophagales bacterium]
MKYEAINNKLFKENRARFVAKMKPNSIAIFQSNDEMPRSADSHHTFRQNPDLFYLSGIDQEKTILILFPDCVREEMREILFIRSTNETLTIWEGHKYSIEEAKTTSGIDKIFWTNQLWTYLPELMFLAENCYLNLNEHGRVPSPVLDKEMRFVHELRQKYPLHQYYRAAPILHELRAVKSNLEIALIQHACNITEKAFRRVLQFVKAGVYEYEIEAEILHEFLINRATGAAYPSIIASGGDSCILHYVDNNKQCKDGDVLLMDFGAEYANYAADLSRTIPVNGSFTERQAAVYNAVLRIKNEATKMLRPGITLKDYNEEVAKIVESELIQLGLLDKKAVANQDKDKPLYKKYFMHGTSHFLGIDVHDVGHRYRPMEAGMIFTCEPGIYIQEENLGIRIENDILVTNGAPVDLMANIPVEVEEIEELMLVSMPF